MDTPHPPFDSFQAAWDFDTAWQAWSSGSSGKTPDLADYFPPSPPPRDFVVSLVEIDLEFRWRLAEKIAESEAIAAPQPVAQAVSGEERPESETMVWLPRRPKLEDYLARFPVLGEAANLPIELIQLECRVRCRYGDRPTVQEYAVRFATHGETLRARLEAELDTVDLKTSAPPVGENAGPAAAHETASGSADSSPERYRKIKKLGEGAFGTVWLAEHRELGRMVALKEPRVDRFRSQSDIEDYLSEARVLASLDHPNIVPVYDFGRTADGSCYVVSKFIDGMDLAAYLQHQTPSFAEAAELIALVADALQQTHNRGLVHRDIKPANILMDSRNQPHVADFGLAIRDEDYGKQLGIAGSPAYMSPEQARPEGHLIDGRSDIFSLGVVLYQLLTGVLPFHGGSAQRVLEMIKLDEPKPPRQRNDAIPRELERICLKALSKRASDRYPCAADLAADLRQWSEAPAMGNNSAATVRIVPKGLRSFDAGDSDFFLDLLPGSRGRNGLPEPLRFWKAVVEETDPEKTFRVGLIFGPSGCGKSSLMKAGLLPRLADHVIRVFVEAGPDKTEQRLLQGLRRACGDLSREASLIDTLAEIRRGKGLPAGRKILLVLDQFEQWLHAHGRERNMELVEALRQCDGQRIQAVLLVRDDFYMDASRLFHELETSLVQGDQQNRNSFAVDLFNPPHARKVLAEFGKAHERLPENLGQLSALQEVFLNQAVAQLAEDGKVICVRLALFADMMKGREWVPETLEQVGGTAGVGETFLEETFSSKHANARYSGHQEAARAVLRVLLPETGTEIKGHVRSHAELFEASGYAKRPEAFAELLKILDSEVRLITPAGEAGKEERDGANGSATQASTASPASPSSSLSSSSSSTGYQLTHDYLVPSLRAWLTRKQRETRRGRAELLLADRAATWNVKNENRQLPSMWEYLNIRAFSRSRRWNDSQRSMMARATRFHANRLAIGTVALVTIVAIGMQVSTSARMQGLIGRLISAEPSELSSVVEELNQYSSTSVRYLSPLLSKPIESLTPDAKRAQLHARIANVSRDPSLVEPLLEEMLAGKVTYVIPIRQQLRKSSSKLIRRLQTLLRDEQAEPKRRFHAAIALADYLPASDTVASVSPSWKAQDFKFVAEQLVSSNSEFQPLIREALKPIQEKLLPNLERIFSDPKATESQRMGATNAFADYTPRDTRRLTRLLTYATPEQFAVLYPLVEPNRSPAMMADLGQIAATLPAENMGSVERVPFGQRRANAAVTLLRLSELEKALSVFNMTDDPEALTQFIFRCRNRGVGVNVLLDCLEIVSAAPPGRYTKEARYALLLTLAEFRLSEVPVERQSAVLKLVRDWYATDPSSGVHGAANWLLRQWGEHAYVKQIDSTPMAPSADREWFTLAVKVKPDAPSSLLGGLFGSKSATPITFYFTFVVFPAGEYTIGSPEDEPQRFDDEARHRVRLTRPFAILNREVTISELIAFRHERYVGFMRRMSARVDATRFDLDREDAVHVSRWLGSLLALPLSARHEFAGADVYWYDAVQFSRWLGTQLDRPLSETDQAYADPDSEASGERSPNPDWSWAPRDWPVDPSRRGFRLPSEAEWEIACRGGVRTSYGFGSDAGLLKNFEWFDENNNLRIHGPMERRPSHRGLFDMHGNAVEWVHDWWDRESKRWSATDPFGATVGNRRVTRGGGWGSSAVNCRAAKLSRSDPTITGYDIGFRLALSFVEVPAETGGDKSD